MKRATTVVLAVLTVAMLTSSVLPAAVLASHEPDNTDYTIDPDDRTPGASEVTYVYEVVLTDNFGDGNSGFDEPTDITFSIPETNVGNCSGSLPGGVDNSYTLTVTNSSSNSQESFDVDEASLSGGTADFDINDPDQEWLVGETLRLSLGSCVNNPGSADWYQGSLTVEGEAFDGDQVSLDANSHYFYICDCENEQEARDQLGAPPSEQTPTPEDTPTPSPTPTPTEEPTLTPTEPEDDEPTPTPTDEPTPTPTQPDDEPTPTPTQATTETDTPDQGEFFGLDPILVVGVVAAISIGLAAFGATRL